MRRLARPVGAFIGRHPALIVAASLALAGVAVFGALRLEMRTSQDEFISSKSQVYRDYERVGDYFGSGNVLILLEGELDSLLSPANVDAMARLQQEISADERVKSVISPVTFLEPAAQKAAQDQGLGAESVPGLMRDPDLIHSVAYTDEGELSASMSGVIPDEHHALINVRLAGGLTTGEENAAGKHIKELAEAQEFEGLGKLIAGNPLMIAGMETRMARSMGITGGMAVLLMVVVLLVVFRARWPLLSLPVVLLGVLVTFGVMGFGGLPITMVTMAGLPILIGLGVDYAIQFHNRYEEERARSSQPAGAIVAAIVNIAPAVGIAVFATILGFIVLLISEVPMVQQFGVVLAFGVTILYLAGLFVLTAALHWRDLRRSLLPATQVQPAALPRIDRVLARGASWALRFPLPIVLVSLAVCGAGVYLDGRLPVVTDVERFVPRGMPELVNLERARAIFADTTEISVLVEAEDVTRPVVLNWMLDFQRQEMEKNPDLLSTNSPAKSVAVDGVIPPSAEVEQALASMPEAVRDSQVSRDRRAALVTFGLPSLSMERMKQLIETFSADAQPPEGVAAKPAGFTVVGARTVDALTANRGTITLVALAAIAAGLLLVYRNLGKALVPILPIALIIGWSSGLMYVMGIDLNPLTAVLGSLIVGIGTEFTVLLTERYYEERSRGRAPRDAMITSVARIGRAISASGLTVAAGFGTLMMSDFPILKDFGKVVVIDVVLALVCTLVILPAIIVWLDGRRWPLLGGARER